jgi:hypothetical protein
MVASACLASHVDETPASAGSVKGEFGRFLWFISSHRASALDHCDMIDDVLHRFAPSASGSGRLNDGASAQQSSTMVTPVEQPLWSSAVERTGSNLKKEA